MEFPILLIILSVFSLFSLSLSLSLSHSLSLSLSLSLLLSVTTLSLSTLSPARSLARARDVSLAGIDFELKSIWVTGLVRQEEARSTPSDARHSRLMLFVLLCRSCSTAAGRAAG